MLGVVPLLMLMPHYMLGCGPFSNATATLQLVISCMLGPRITPSRLLSLQGSGFSNRKIYCKFDIDLEVIKTNDVV